MRTVLRPLDSQRGVGELVTSISSLCERAAPKRQPVILNPLVRLNLERM